MKFPLILCCLFAAPALASSGPVPDGKTIFLHGNQTGALPCAACHGIAALGNAGTGAPRLAGLPAGVITGALVSFANGGGGSATMQFIAQALSPAEAAAVAQYLSSLPK